MRCPNSSMQTESKEGQIPPSFAISTQALHGLGDAHTHGGSILLYRAYWLKSYSHPETPCQTHPEINFNLVTL